MDDSLPRQTEAGQRAAIVAFRPQMYGSFRRKRLTEVFKSDGVGIPLRRHLIGQALRLGSNPSSEGSEANQSAGQLCRLIRWHREERNDECFQAGPELQIGQFIGATRLSAAA